MNDDPNNKPVLSNSGTPDAHPQEQLASVARAQVDSAYHANPPHQKEGDNPYQRTHVENFDWRNYHSAWQQYYQQYYYRYYAQQAASQQQKAQPQIDAAQEPTQITENEQPTRVQQFRNDLRNQVSLRAKQFRGSHHFIPVLSALAVGLIFLFLQFNSILVANVKAYVSPGQFSEESAAAIDPNAAVTVGAEPRLIIPKINVDVPVDYNVTTLNESQILSGLRESAVHYNLPGADAVPGQLGNTVILGHSGNDIFSRGQYKFVFVLLDKMAAGDTFYLHYQGKRYVYKVTEVKIINPNEVSALQVGTSKAIATLVTCTPPGSSYQRRLVFGEQISPDPNGAAPAKVEQPNVNATIPGTSPTVLEQIWDFFF